MAVVLTAEPDSLTDGLDVWTVGPVILTVLCSIALTTASDCGARLSSGVTIAVLAANFSRSATVTDKRYKFTNKIGESLQSWASDIDLSN